MVVHTYIRTNIQPVIKVPFLNYVARVWYMGNNFPFQTVCFGTRAAANTLQPCSFGFIDSNGCKKSEL